MPDTCSPMRSHLLRNRPHKTTLLTLNMNQRHLEVSSYEKFQLIKKSNVKNQQMVGLHINCLLTLLHSASIATKSSPTYHCNRFCSRVHRPTTEVDR